MSLLMQQINLPPDYFAGVSLGKVMFPVLIYCNVILAGIPTECTFFLNMFWKHEESYHEDNYFADYTLPLAAEKVFFFF